MTPSGAGTIARSVAFGVSAGSGAAAWVTTNGRRFWSGSVTDSTGSGLSPEREQAIRAAWPLHAASMQGTAAVTINELLAEIDQLRADLVALREAGNALAEEAEKHRHDVWCADYENALSAWRELVGREQP